MPDPIDEYLRRPGRYENIDGLIDVGWGLMLLGFALFERLRNITSPESLLHRPPAKMVYIVALVLALHYGRKAVKKYVTYPRTGFIEHRKTLRTQLSPVIGVVLGAVVSLAAVLVLRQGTRAGETLLICLSNGFFYAVVTRLDRAWKWGVLLAMTAGVAAIALTPLHRDAFEQLWMAFLGVNWVLSGVITFTLYLRHTNPPERTAE